MERQEVIKILTDTDVLMEGHFLLTSGRHSDKYLQCAKIFQYPKHASRIAAHLALQVSDDGIDLVIGPAIGGIILSYEMGRALGVKTIFAERENGVMTLKRGFEVPPRSRVLVVEDVVTTGGSVKEVIELLKEHQAEVSGVAAIVDRSGGKVDFGTKFVCAVRMDVVSYKPEECPLCASGIALVKPGSRVFAKP
jgi:orotate phosphoribosyltransferase